MMSRAIDLLRQACTLVASGTSATDAARALGRILEEEDSSIEIDSPDTTFSRISIRRDRGTDGTSYIQFEMSPGQPILVPRLQVHFGDYSRDVQSNPWADYPVSFYVAQPGAPSDARLSTKVRCSTYPTGDWDIPQGTVTRLTAYRYPKRSRDAGATEPDTDLHPPTADTTENERSLAVDRLKARLGESADPRVPDALVALKAKDAGEPLRRALAQHPDKTFRVAVARALKLLEGSDEAEPVIVDVLTTGTPAERIAAAETAIHFDAERIGEALAQLLTHAHGAVRRAAFVAFLSFLGLAPYTTSRRSLLGIMAECVASPLEAVRRDVFERFAGIIDQMRDGKRPEDMGLDHLVSEALAREERQWDLAALFPAEGPDREWLERALLSGLARSSLVITRVASLKVARAVEPLRELLNRYEINLRADAARALLTMSDDPAIRQQAEAVLAEPPSELM